MTTFVLLFKIAVAWTILSCFIATAWTFFLGSYSPFKRKKSKQIFFFPYEPIQIKKKAPLKQLDCE